MDKKEILKERYLKLVDYVKFISICRRVSQFDNDKLDSEFATLSTDFQIIVDDYLNQIQNQHLELIALDTIKDYLLSQKVIIDEHNTPPVENWHGRQKENKLNGIKLTLKKLDYIQSFYNAAIFEFIVPNKDNVLFELIGATPPKRNTKPTKETKLALTQNELMCLFRKLANEKLFTSSDSSHLARGIESLSQFSANKTRVKGQTMNSTELKNIKKVIDNISAILQKDIEQGGI